MVQPTTFPRCPNCQGPMHALRVGNADRVRDTMAECDDPACGERTPITVEQWVEAYRPRRPADALAADLTPALLQSVGLLSC